MLCTKYDDSCSGRVFMIMEATISCPLCPSEQPSCAVNCSLPRKLLDDLVEYTWWSHTQNCRLSLAAMYFNQMCICDTWPHLLLVILSGRLHQEPLPTNFCLFLQTILRFILEEHRLFPWNGIFLMIGDNKKAASNVESFISVKNTATFEIHLFRSGVQRIKLKKALTLGPWSAHFCEISMCFSLAPEWAQMIHTCLNNFCDWSFFWNPQPSGQSTGHALCRQTRNLLNLLLVWSDLSTYMFSTGWWHALFASFSAPRLFVPCQVMSMNPCAESDPWTQMNSHFVLETPS